MGLTASSFAAAPAPDANATLVVYNENDPDSKSLAGYYAGKRGIPSDHVIGLDVSGTEEISRAEYDQRIRDPLRKIFEDRGWWELESLPGGKKYARKSAIRYVALVRGMPIKIAADAAISNASAGNVALPKEVRTRNEASVASELVALGVYDYDLNGVMPNPYYRRFSPSKDTDLGVAILLTAQLDGATPADVRRMIDDSLETERTGLRGWAYVDGRGIKEGGYAEGDKWMANAAKEMQRQGIPVVYDNAPELIDADYPMNNVALYYGWYAENICGPFIKPDFHFQKGAVAVHIHSGSASTLRDPQKNWSAPLIAKGAAATLGNVYEPYLSLTTDLDVFQDRLQSGFTLAESAWMGTRGLSWMNAVIGDPLYRPFAFLSDSTMVPDPKNKVWRECRKMLSSANGNSAIAAKAFENAAEKTGQAAYLDFLAAAYVVDGKTDQALTALEKATQMAKNEEERFDLLLKRIFLLSRSRQQLAAANLARESQTLFSGPARQQLLGKLATQFDPLVKNQPIN